MANKAKTTHDENRTFERSLLRAVRSARWLLPTSERAVEEEELIGGETASLPAELSDPLAALDPSQRRRTTSAHQTPGRADEVDESLARAAREGNENAAISPEAESRMQNDRRKAESDRDE